MKCPRCKFYSICKGRLNKTVENCVRFKSVDETNDEWRRTCSTEEFAKWIYDIRFDFQIPWKNKEIVQWLKEKHEE